MRAYYLIFRTLYSLIQNLSLDVVLGAVVISWLTAKSLGQSIVPEIYLIQALCVWVIYTLDHLLDSKKINQKAKTRRHLFHQKYFDPLAISVVIATGVCFLLCFRYLPKQTWNWGLIIAGFSALHLFVAYYLGKAKSRWTMKELIIAINYSAGIFVPSASIKTQIKEIDLFLFLLLTGVAFMNLVMYSFFDLEKDFKHDQNSIAVSFGAKATQKILTSLFWLILITGCAGLLLFNDANPYQLFYMCFMICIGLLYYLMILLIDRNYISESYRRIGDLVFIIPIILPLF